MTKEEIKSLINNKIGGQGNQVDLGGALKSVLNELVEGGESMESITWAELKAKRDEGKLVAGAQYRITDYECTTSQENTFAASHKFDIIVTADDERTLNENARAIAKEANFLDGTYFVDDGDHCVYVGERIVDGVKAYFWKPTEGFDDDTYGWYSQLPIEELAKLSKEELFQAYFSWKDSPDPLVWDDTFQSASFSSYQIAPYFATNLSAWELKYCLDNDKERFAWAQEFEFYCNELVLWSKRNKRKDKNGYFGWISTDGDEIYTKSEYPKIGDVIYDDEFVEWYKIDDIKNGKGVIYYMKDEWNNECPYDFKNIMFNGDWGYFAYTFNWINDESSNHCEDLSVIQFVHKNDEGGYSHTYGNVIKPYGENEDTLEYGYPYRLNFIVFLNNESYEGGIYYGCYSNTFGNDCHNNTLGNNCYDNTFGNECYHNTLKDGCFSNTFGIHCVRTTLGDYCYSNTFGDYCFSNTFGNDCHNNIFGNECSNNSFGDECYANTFGRGDSQNIFGYDCTNITFGKNCTDNVLGNNNKFITFGDDCSDNKFSEENSNIRYVYVLAGVNSVSIQVQENASFPQFVARNSSGGMRTWAPAD